jgi:CRISPR-associated exonuclease Cas4
MMEYLAVLCLILAVLLFFLARRRRRQAGIPGGRVVYTDTRAWGAVEKPLYDADLGLTGRPDYLVESGRHLIPVEVKSSRLPDSPYDSHIYQLGAYCLLVERVLERRPPYGLIHYTDRSGGSRTFAIDYTPQLEAAVLEKITEIRAQEKSKNVPRSHNQAARCARCGYRSICEEKLGN